VPTKVAFCRNLASHSKPTLLILSFLLPLIPAIIAISLNSTTGTTGTTSEDGPILSAWTHLQVAIFALYVYLASSGPPNYLTAYTFTMLALGLFMQQLGKPIGIGLAMRFRLIGFQDPLGPASATYLHHLAVGLGTWLMAWVAVEMMKECAQPTATRRTESPEEVIG
jgi:hypothetical protein